MPKLSRRKRLAPPSLRLHKPSGQAVVTLGGRDIYLGPHDDPHCRTKYHRLLAAWEENGRQLPDDYDPHVEDAFELDDLIDVYLDFAESYYRKNGRPTSTMHTIASALTFAHELYGTEPAHEFSPRRLKACRQAMIDANLSRKTCNKYTDLIRQMFRWGVEEEYIYPTLLQGLEAVAGLRKGRTDAREPEDVKPVPWAFVAAIEDHVPRQVWAMIQLQDLTGMRPGEVVSMRAVDLDTAGDVWVYVPREHKTEHHDADRFVDLGPKAQAIIRPFLAGRSIDACLFSPREAEDERRAAQRAKRKTPLYPSHQNRKRADNPRRRPRECYDSASYRRAIHRAIDKVNKQRENDGEPEIPKWSPNQLRHNAGTRARREAGLETSQVVLGHKDAKTTEIYAERDRALSVRFALQHG